MTRFVALLAVGMLVISCRELPHSSSPMTAQRASKAERDAKLDAMMRLMARADEADRERSASEPLVREVLVYFERTGDQQLVADLHARLGMLLEAQGRTESAREHYLEAITALAHVSTLELEDRDVLAIAASGAARTK